MAAGYVQHCICPTVARHDRIFEIHRRLKAGRRFTAKALGEHLGCCERTIRRDLQHLADHYHMPLRFDPREGTWHYTQDVGDIPATLVSVSDRRALLVARQAVEQFAGTPWYSQLKAALGKLLEVLPGETVSQFEKVASRIRFEGPPLPPIATGIWDTICNCIEGSETLALRYRSGHCGQVGERKIDPYGLVVSNRLWYLVGWDHRNEAVRTFLLSRIQAADYTDSSFQVRDGFDLDEYLSTSIDGHQSTGPVYTVRLRFSTEASAAAEDERWNRTQRQWLDRRGRLVVELRTGALYAVRRRVLGWGGQCEVLEPKELKAQCQQGGKA